MDIIIRNAKVEDAQSIVQAEQEIAQVPGYFCSQPSELSEENVKKTISNIDENGDGVYLVAEHNKQIVGHAFLLQLDLESLHHVAELTVVVHKEWQEKGIGKKLMQKLIVWAQNSNTVEKIELNVRATNIRAISLYKQMGFHEEGRLKNRVKIGHKYIDDLIMALEVKKNHSRF